MLLRHGLRLINFVGILMVVCLVKVFIFFDIVVLYMWGMQNILEIKVRNSKRNSNDELSLNYLQNIKKSFEKQGYDSQRQILVQCILTLSLNEQYINSVELNKVT
ncbi:unnamed protein product [Paramecium sonneborni]|uniref:Uncharacterized protein n=1 Tax=Paramecium sonneborni TaxID=65129 RepID=A0A8S1RKZ2_9CILI|nr:unnamed protein product [Paramecium sonneborni]